MEHWKLRVMPIFIPMADLENQINEYKANGKSEQLYARLKESAQILIDKINAGDELEELRES